MKLNECIIKHLNEEDRLNESTSDINSLAKSIENILKQCNADISYVESYRGDDDIDSVNSKVKEYAYNRIDISCKFKVIIGIGLSTAGIIKSFSTAKIQNFLPVCKCFLKKNSYLTLRFAPSLFDRLGTS